MSKVVINTQYDTPIISIKHEGEEYEAPADVIQLCKLEAQANEDSDGTHKAFYAQFSKELTRELSWPPLPLATLMFLNDCAEQELKELKKSLVEMQD